MEEKLCYHCEKPISRDEIHYKRMRVCRECKNSTRPCACGCGTEIPCGVGIMWARYVKGHGNYGRKGEKRKPYKQSKRRIYTYDCVCGNTWEASRNKTGLCPSCRMKLRREERLEKKYGISSEEVEKLFKEQGGRCAICDDEFEDSRRTHIDHCHDTGRVRGLLCTRCNIGLGFFLDDVERLKGAIEYVERNR